MTYTLPRQTGNINKYKLTSTSSTQGYPSLSRGERCIPSLLTLRETQSQKDLWKSSLKLFKIKVENLWFNVRYSIQKPQTPFDPPDFSGCRDY